MTSTPPLARWNITLPEPLANKIEVLLHDEILGKPGYGARSSLIEQLLSQWLQAHTKNIAEHDGKVVTQFTLPLSVGNISIAVLPTGVDVDGCVFTPEDLALLRGVFETAIRIHNQHRRLAG